MDNLIQQMQEAGLKLIQLKSDKTPTGKWKEQSSEITDANYVGLVCGSASGGVEGLDFDLKYDITGTLIQRYKEIVNDLCPSLLSRLVIQKTMNNGFHLIYRCSKIEGNQKLANRDTTVEEKNATYELNISKGRTPDEADKASKNDKVRVLIETRGEGGYFMIYPSKGYGLAKGSFTAIPTISEEEREILINTARTFNERLLEVEVKVSEKAHEGFHITPLNDFNERGDVVGVLVRNGWTIVGEKGDKVLVKRVGHTTSAHSGNFDKKLRWFSVFSTSTEFEPQKAYKPATVYAMLECNGDYSRAASQLNAEGYGTRNEERKVDKKKDREIVIDENLSFLEDETSMRTYIESVRNGSLQLGFSTGIKSLDTFFLFKKQQFNIINGFPNVGKTTVAMYKFLLASIIHDWKWTIISNENKNAALRSTLMGFYIGKSIKEMNDLEYRKAYEFVQEHFFMIKNDNLYSHEQMLEMGSTVRAKHSTIGMFIDPFNSILPKIPFGMNSHDYQYQQLSEMRVWTKQEDSMIFLNTHTNTMAMRTKDANGKKQIPSMADNEGGTKFGSKADDFLTYHRDPKDPTCWNESIIQVQKVKDTMTGGKVSYDSEPIVLRMLPNSCGFIDVRFNEDPIQVAKSAKNVQSSIPIPKAESQKVELDIEKYKIKENTSFLNTYPDDDEYQTTSTNEEAPF
jgi:hypothetical protein